MIVLIRIQDAFTSLPLRVILEVSACFYMDMNCFGLVCEVSCCRWTPWLRIFLGWLLQMVSGGCGWFQVVSGGFGWFRVVSGGLLF